VSYFDTEYGLLNVHQNLQLPEENSPLWSIQYYLLNTCRPDIYFSLVAYWGKCETETEGLFNQRPWKDGSKEDYMSNDQLIALICLNCKWKQENIRIWSYLWKHLFTYNNLTGKIDFNRLMQPKAVLVSAYSAGHKVVLPLLSFTCILSCLSDDHTTSGKLKAWTIMESFNLKRTMKICTFLVGSWDKVFNTYYWQEDHPLGSN